MTLVHGTFARHAPWIQDGADLPETLRASGDVVLDRFCWSGRNRHSDRLAAGDELRRHLVDLVTRCRTDDHAPQHHVIGHSHGGNVALYAIRPRGDEHDALLESVQVTTLATPFLTMRRRPLPLRVFLMLIVFVVGAAFMIDPAADAVRMLLELSVQASLWVDDAADWSLVDFSTASLAGFSWLVLAVLLIFTLVRSVFVYWRGPSDQSLWRLVSGTAVIEEADLITTTDLGSDRLLVIRGLGDEAAEVLGGARLASWAMEQIVRRVSPGRVVKLVLKGYAYVLVAIFAISIGLGIFGRSDQELDTTLNILIGAFFLGALLLVVAAGLSLLVIPAFVVLANLPFGDDALFWNLFSQTTAEPAPMGGARVLQVRRRDDDADDPDDLAHTVYDDPPAMRAIVARVHGGDPSQASLAPGG